MIIDDNKIFFECQVEYLRKTFVFLHERFSILLQEKEQQADMDFSVFKIYSDSNQTGGKTFECQKINQEIIDSRSVFNYD
ncbi:hypothetical protein MUP95_02725 [bacterium]|nr:hypothetical protein [bacterium]